MGEAERKALGFPHGAAAKPQLTFERGVPMLLTILHLSVWH
jgi:hypothetical protein